MKLASSACIAVVGILSSADANAFRLGTPAEEHPERTAQNAALEFRFGPYRPEVDDGVTGHPFDESFGTGPRVYAGVELDWEIYRIPYLGTIGAGFQAGRAFMSRKSKAVVGTYELTVYPIAVDAVLRVDQLWRGGGVPFMPYAKVGAGVGFWEASVAFRKVLANGTDASGRSYGPVAAFGAAIPLDFLDANSTRVADRSIGINTSSIFLEYSLVELNSLGGSHALRVGDGTWVAGLVFEL